MDPIAPLEIRLERIGAMPKARGGYRLAAIAVTHDGAALFLFIERSSFRNAFARFTSGVGSFARSRLDRPCKGELVRVDAGKEIRIRLSGIDATYPIVDMLPGGEIIIAAPRCMHYDDGTADENLSIYGSDGRVLRRSTIGDGLSSVQTDAAGRIWASYFDEGVAGNFGWGGDGAEPIGSCGLICFDSSGNQLWRFHLPGPKHRQPIDDAYALNVTRTSAHVYYYYSDFSVCVIDAAFVPIVRKTPLRGCKDFALDDHWYLFTGQYKEAPDVAHLLHGDGDALSLRRTLSLRLPDGQPVATKDFVGRGAKLYYFNEEEWFAADVVRAAEQARA